MITESISEYLEIGWKRKAIKACILLAEEEMLINSDETIELWQYVDKYIPEDKY